MSKKDGFYERKKGFEGMDGVIIVEGETLIRLQKYLLNMLKDIAQVCEANHIFYTLSGGSILGTVRHQGFIPWDDDIDLNMPRADFEKLKTVFEEQLGDRYELVCPEKSSGHGLSVSQIKRKGTVYRSYNELSQESPGICIDIFILENTYDNALARKLHGILCLASGYILTCRKTFEDLPYLKKYLDQNEGLSKEFNKKAKLGRIVSWIKLDSCARFTKKVYSLCGNNNSKHVSIPSGRKHYFGEMYLREDMCQSIWMKFEDMDVRIPKGYKTYLTIMYGDTYMELPPVEKREHHPLMELDFGEDK